MAWSFDPPGKLTDFAESSSWDSWMSSVTKETVADLASLVLQKDTPTEGDIAGVRDRICYVDPSVDAPPADAATQPIPSWNGFPRAVARSAPWPDLPPLDSDPDGRWRAAEHLGTEDLGNPTLAWQDGSAVTNGELDVRDRQDEYLEWHAQTDAEGKLVGMTFVAEGYDYFEQLFLHQPATVAELYSQFTGNAAITPDDLRLPQNLYVERGTKRLLLGKKGDFNPRNRFNRTDGIIHLSHRANALGAEVNLAGVSAITRKTAAPSGVLDGSDAERVLCCSAGGEPNRNSDPLIAQQAYGLALANTRYTLSNPVGLYIAGVDEQRVALPDGSAVPREWWTAVRGEGMWTDASRVLRLELAVPTGAATTLEDLTVDGLPVRHAAQLASLVSVHLFVTTWPTPIAEPLPPTRCVATCCQQTGTEILSINSTGEPCAPGSTLKYPGLIPTIPVGPSPHLAVASTAVDEPSRGLLRRSRALPQ